MTDTSKQEHPVDSAFRRFSPISEKCVERTTRVFPGGDTRASATYFPYPLAIKSGEGCRLTDVDGNVLNDFMNNFTSLIHGHAFSPTVGAVQTQVALGTAFAAPCSAQIELAELIVDRIPSVEQIRFTSSGTESTQMAIRCARAATGRQKVMKMEGGYHGSYEMAEVSMLPLPNECGPIEAPVSLSIDDSFPDSALTETIVCPYNEPDIAANLIAENAEVLAAVIVEPMLGSMGMVPATTEFLSALRRETESRGIVLIFDEVITFRLNTAGMQALHGISPDLTCLGKVIGGGLPIGAIGGRRDLLQLFSPEQRKVGHASTFSGNALSMAAGLAAMTHYNENDIDRLDHLGNRLRQGFSDVFRSTGIKGQATGVGSLVNIHLTDRTIMNARDTFQGMIDAGEIARLLHLSMLQNGVMSAPRMMYCISSPMTEQEVDHAIAALESSLTNLMPYIAAEQPNLLANG